jgi:vacuolar-type H+-ATPase subunit I/STV1
VRYVYSSDICAEKVSTLNANIKTIKENIEALLEAGNEVGLEVKTEKNKYNFMSRQQNARQNVLKKTGKFKIFGNRSKKSKLNLQGN